FKRVDLTEIKDLSACNLKVKKCTRAEERRSRHHAHEWPKLHGFSILVLRITPVPVGSFRTPHGPFSQFLLSPLPPAMHTYTSGVTAQFTWNYDRGETVADAVVHIRGLAMATGGAAVLAVVAAHEGDITELTAVAIYLTGFLAMFGFSAAYNLWPVSPLKWWLRRLDHSAIYLLIAATYTAFML